MYLILNIIAVIFICNFVNLVIVSSDHSYNYVNLPESHMPYYFNSFPKVIDECLSNSSCIYRSLLNSDKYNADKCWGYEQKCKLNNAFSKPYCGGQKPAWIKTYDEYVGTFYDQADFGMTAHMHLVCFKNVVIIDFPYVLSF